ncbi:uncharacterized protein LOC130892310 [Diorhabda carinulata]|uniref:uncharacterized protein LOC130892310 n=1 Tax=Diorhabda carinulata TaxID=1163345 RepID=UPI0025A20591|nr:uncharacterized protein LOC130892310 [Diorhabda carinulata]
MDHETWTAKYQSEPTDLQRIKNRLNNGITEKNGEDGECSMSDKDDIKDFVKNEPCTDAGTVNITISEKEKQTIHSILEQIKPLSQVEKFLFFLKLPSEVTNALDPFRQPLNPLGSRSEITRTISWIKTHLEEDPDISLPKQEVYNEYHNYCANNGIKPLSQADFGKVMKQVYPKVRARRLGTRGNSRYCYSGLRRYAKLKPPLLPDLTDKPLSTEIPFSQTSISSAAWLIVKEWSEKKLNQHFSSIQSLAYHLIINHLVGTTSDAASKITSAGIYPLKDDGNAKESKHREMQLQLQRKIQQKNEGRDRKKRTQSPKSEQKPSIKKSRSQSVPAQNVTNNFSPTSTNGGINLASGECSTTSSSSSTSPTQAKIICDKSLDFTQLPDFNSFQKPAVDSGVVGPTGQDSQLVITTNKVRISKLHPSPSNQSCNVMSTSSRKQKYKSLRPRLQPCDIASYNPQPQPEAEAENRSQHNVHDIARIKESNSDEECDFPLTRERLNSISNVSKDAMDEYLGTNNSQHEEELSKYFSNNNNNNITESNESEDTSKLSTLRQLLVQNIVDTKPPILENRVTEHKAVPFANTCSINLPVQNNLSYIHSLTQHEPPNAPVNVKRRVSFETPASEDSVPPSPNTRRKNFSFTPISPGPQSPSGIHSKCSSTSASPFVSPRNTPILRNKPAHQTTSILKSENRKSLRIKREIDLTLEIPNENQQSVNLLPMSAPVSPMLNNNKSVLQKLLNSTSKVPYNPSYTAVANINVQPDSSLEVNQFLTSNVESNLEGYRSRSVPLHNMINPMDNVYANTNNDFSEVDPIPDSESDNVKRILNSLEDPPVDMDITSSNGNLREFGFQLYSNSIDFSQHEFGNQRLARSQSIGGEVTLPQIIPSRSVPNTPLPFIKPQKINYNNSRSYPSTPLNNDGSFTYNINGDCLLNGQPIRNDDVAESLDYLQDFEINRDGTTEQLTHEKDFNIASDFDIVENESQLINTGLIEANFIDNID